MTTFYDTSSLLLIVNSLFQWEDEHIAISSITLKELENIKTSSRKDENIKFLARKLTTILRNNPQKWECVIFKEDYLEPIKNASLEINDDMRILSCAIWYNNNVDIDDTYFGTNDLCLGNIANLFLGEDQIFYVGEEDEDDSYTGIEELYLTQEEMINFYSGNFNYPLYEGQYINIYDSENNNNLVDTQVKTSEGFRKLRYDSFNSRWLGNVKPIKNDIYQAMYADSLMNNQLTLVKGPAGSGKSFLAMAYLFNLLERGKISKIIIFCNPVATKNAAKLGFYPGTRDEKLLDSQIGNFLVSKLGGRDAVEQLMNNEQLLLLPFADIRGYDTTGMNAGIYITEAQNLDVSLLKLALQRAGEDSIFIIDGDTKSQVDLIDYEGSNNGMRRASQVFRGTDLYGEITLKKVHRSKIAAIAERM